MEPLYGPQGVEERWQRIWEEEGHYAAEPDPGYVRAVLRWFVHLHERGYLYRANRIVNWCPGCASAVSDLEVKHEDANDTLYRIRYPFADGSGHVTIATVRPPTMLADVAV